MANIAQQKSRIYGFLQTIVFVVFGGAVFLGPARPLLLTGNSSRIAGNLLCVIGLLLLFAAISRLGRAIQINPQPRPDAQLVTTGIYKWFRHPIYTAITLIVTGLFLRRPTVVIAIAATVVVIFLALKLRFEENLLLARYPGYAEYRKRSWGLLPWPRQPSNRR